MDKVTPPSSRYVLGIDIGGTKIDAALFALENGLLSRSPAWNCNLPAQKGLSAHVSQVTSIIAEAARQIKACNGIMAAIGIASPGRFDSKGYIKPGTNTNLGLRLDEFDTVNLSDEYSKVLKTATPTLGAIPLCVANDANAMLAGILDSIRTDKAASFSDQNNQPVTIEDMNGRYVGLLGIGTGIGHAIAVMHDNGQFHFVTDGHASKLKVPVDESDLTKLQHTKESMESNSEKEEILLRSNNTCRAEDLFRGPVITAMAGVRDGSHISQDNPRHRDALAFAGKYMARTIALIRSGTSEDIEQCNAWSPEDKAEAARTSLYFISGGMGQSRPGKAIIDYALQELEYIGIKDIRLIQYLKEHSAARSAAALALPNQ